MGIQDFPQMIVAPVSRRTLRLVEESSGSYLVTTEQPVESFAVLLGIPLLLPTGFVADWDHNVLEVILGIDAHTVVAEAACRFGENDAATDAVATWIADKIGIDAVREAVRSYSRLPVSERLKWRPCAATSADPRATLIDDDALQRARRYATRENGMKRLSKARDYVNGWGFHLPLFRRLVRGVGYGTVLELGCGAGVGTCAVLDGIDERAHLFPIDVDFACAANCLGIREAAHCEDRLHPIVASFWYLPFADASVNLVCSHYGIDETREVTAALREVARVLNPGGSLISVSKTDPTARIRTYLGRLGLSDSELTTMAQEADLYGGPEHLAARAADCGLQLVDAYSTHNLRSHDRTVFYFRKG